MHIGYVASNEVAFHSNAYYSSEIGPNVFTFMVNDLPDGDSLCVDFLVMTQHGRKSIDVGLIHGSLDKMAA